MNINAISSFNNMVKAQSFKGESQKLYQNPYEIIPDDVSDDTIVDYRNPWPNYPIPVTAGERRAQQREELARIAAEAAMKQAQPQEAPEEKTLTVEEMAEQSRRYLRD